MLAILEDGDWEEVFKYAEPHLCEHGEEHSPKRVVTQVKTDGFTRDDVKRVIAFALGENDGPSWRA
jgi:hypothetical protein